MDILCSFVNLASAATIQGVRVSILLFADDCVILSESASGLQRRLCTLWDYCDKNNLTVIMEKTNTMSFKTRRVMNDNKMTILYGDVELEQVESFVYLGVKITDKCKIHTELAPILQKAARTWFKLS